LALVQFSSIDPFLVVLLGFGSVQLLVGIALEPALMGRSLNLSALVIITSLVIWGLLWGIPGLFLATPMTVMAALICAHFESSRWIAVLLSSDGRITPPTGRIRRRDRERAAVENRTAAE
ncbi:MAG: AI-2E family transporter, partial [Geminicoccaceae bacterium]